MKSAPDVNDGNMSNSSSCLASVKITRNETQAKITIAGDLMAADAPQIKPQISQLVESGVREITFDLAGATIIDSTGIGLLVATRNSLARHGGRIRVTQLSAELVKLFRSMRLDRHLDISGR